MATTAYPVRHLSIRNRIRCHNRIRCQCHAARVVAQVKPMRENATADCRRPA